MQSTHPTKNVWGGMAALPMTGERVAPFIPELIELVPTKAPGQCFVQAKLPAVLTEQGLELRPGGSGGAIVRQTVTTY